MRRGPIERCALEFARLTWAARRPRDDRHGRLHLRRPVAALPERRAVARRGCARLPDPHCRQRQRSMHSCAIEPEGVLAAASSSEARWRAGSPLGPIDGVPASIKDNIWVKGLPTRRGSKTSDATPAAADSPAVARLREQGAVILGKTCMPEHGWIGVCHSPIDRHHPQSMESRAHAGRLDRRRGGGGVAGLGRAASGHRRRRLAAHPGCLHRRVRHEAELRPGAGLSGAPAQRALAPGADHPYCRRCRADAVGDRAAGCTRYGGLEYAGAEFHSPAWMDGVRGLRVAFSPRLGQDVALDPEIEAASRKAARALEEQGAVGRGGRSAA